MYILGISCFYHDSSAALLKDSVIIAAAAQERFSRIKHDTSFPTDAINFCLKQAGITIEEINYIGFYEKPLLKLERILYQHLEMFPLSLKTFLSSMPSILSQKLAVVSLIKKRLGFKKAVFFIEHHLAHAASSYLPSSFNKAAIVTCDGVGESTTTSFGIGSGNDIKLLKQITFPHSLGLLYSTITAYLGFSVNNSEYKVMGLSAYGDNNSKTNKYYKKLKQIIDIKSDGSYHLDMDYLNYHFSDKMPSKKLCQLLGGPVRKPLDQITNRHQDIAAAAQLMLEEVLTKIFQFVQKTTGEENVVFAGGVALNSVFNSKILSKTKFKNIWISPDPGDGGGSVGVCCYIYNTILGKKRITLDSAYLGPKFSSKEIERFLLKNKIVFKKFRNKKQLIERCARLIFEDKILGWFQGQMEWGPRALGARSILSNPCNPNIKEILNTKVKHREKFRPFAPVVCQDDTKLYFETGSDTSKLSDFMLTVYPIKKIWRKKVPGVTHIDGSGRLQTIKRAQNPLFYDLIKRFGQLSGVSMLINTSFNIRGEPIVCTPLDAYKCLMGTGIDYLIMGEFLVKRDDNSKDFWDSEKYAKD
ncbi:hypothetical protein HYS93_01360 [Candidatus Daviesbacteria bacterium]|nr:hypothetical protein [Candidatus Daviesbacteria bacterium]